MSQKALAVPGTHTNLGGYLFQELSVRTLKVKVLFHAQVFACEIEV